jgi:N-acetyl-anhydromuramyl-L-alanine amidase AmpD
MEVKNLIRELEWHPTKRWSVRSLNRINKIIIHQELAEGTIESVNQYHIHPNHISNEGCPHFCYHYGIRRNGEIIQANELSSVTWHTKDNNPAGIGIMLAGNFEGPGHNLGTKEPSAEQMKALEELSSFLINSLMLNNQSIYGHYHFGKPVCPGYIVKKCIEKKRNDLSESPEIQKVEKTIKEIQKRLKKLGYNSGRVDGIIGIRTLAAIRKFQSDNKLTVDGMAGPETWKTLVKLTI